MTSDINLGGTIYVTSKRAAEITGYTQDYVGQLARSGAIEAQRISGLWYIAEKSLRDHKENADTFRPEIPVVSEVKNDLETSISFDGRDFISAQRASVVAGYNQDYVGQLARAGKVDSRQIGNRWYIDRAALLEHKRTKDALLAAVQVESVGLQKIELKDEPSDSPDLHFSYDEPVDAVPSLPLAEAENLAREAEVQEDGPFLEEMDHTEKHIPIRVFTNDAPVEELQLEAEEIDLAEEYLPRASIARPSAHSKKMSVVMTYVLAGAVTLTFIAGGWYIATSNNATTTQPVVATASVGVKSTSSGLSQGIQSALSRIFAKEITYTR